MTDPLLAGAEEQAVLQEFLSESPGAPEPTDTWQDNPRGLYGDAWVELRGRVMFWIPVFFIVVFVVMSIFPGLFTSKNPNSADLINSLGRPSSKAWFGYDLQGADIYSECIHGARVSLLIGIFSTLVTFLLGAVAGILAGWRGGWIDAIVSRIADVFFGIPFLLGGIVVLETFSVPGKTGEVKGVILVIVTLSLLSWPVVLRLMRSSVIATKNADYVEAARALGASPARLIRKHVLPNSIAPVLVFASVSVGGFIGAEASLSYLGLGLPAGTVSWGSSIDDAKDYITSDIYLLLFPSAFLVVAVLSFVLLGEVIREAIDPKLR